VQVSNSSTQFEKFSSQGSVLTLGVFDGVHLGHQALITEAVNSAKYLNTKSIVVTYDPHPSQILTPSKSVPAIFSRQDLTQQLKTLSVDHLVIEPFTKELAEISALEYLQNFILKPFQPQTIFIGYDFVFGKGRAGTFDFLQYEGERRGFSVKQISPVLIEGRVVSSSLIRDLIQLGDFNAVKSMLGRHFYISGEVVHGDGRGRTIGFPTLNLKSDIQLYPRNGVYLTQVECQGSMMPSITNIGVRPTFYKDQQCHVVIETHLINKDLNLYGEKMKLHILLRLRDELKFNSTESLVSQINSDLALAKKYFGF
jgi:riboflavin kinase/FMN adenylyltransferase